MRSSGGVDRIGSDACQREHHVDPAQHEHAVLGFHFPVRHRSQMPLACRDPARLQRATQCAEQSAARRGDDVVDRGRVWFLHVTVNTVVASDRTVGAEAHRLLLGGHPGKAQWPLDARQRDLGLVDDVAQGYSFR